MGKSQKKKAMRRHNPVRVPDSHLPKGLTAASESSSKSTEILPIIQKMESPDAAERKWACVAVCNIIQNDPSTRRLLQGKNIVGSLITRLTDSEEEVVVEAVGTLRNLCIDGGYDICAEMYNKNIITPLKSFIPKISSTLTTFLASAKASPDSVKRIVYDFAENVITILWCLSETSNKALNAINEMNLISFLMSFLSARGHLPLGPVLSAAQSLYVLTDDNVPAIKEVKNDASYIACLLSIAQQEIKHDLNTQKDPRVVTLAVLAAGTLRNIIPIPPPSAASFVDLDKEVVLPLLQPVISSISIQDVTNTVQELLHRQETEPQLEKMSLKHGPHTDHKTTIERDLEVLEAKLRTVQLALEILTGACATLPDPDPGLPADQEDGEEDEETEEETFDSEMDTEMDMEDDSTSPKSSSFITSLVEPLLALIQPTSLSFPPLASPSIHPPTTSALSALHVCAMECLNNIFLSLTATHSSSLSADIHAGSTIWDGIWSSLSLVGTQTGLGQEKRREMWNVAVGVFWGIGRVWRGSITPVPEQVQVLIQLCDSSSDEHLKVKCIGALECLAHNINAVDANKTIAEYLLSLLPSGSVPSKAGTESMIQATSAIIDIYSDEELPYDINFRQGAYVNRLVDSVDGVRKAVKGIDRHKAGGRELRRRGDEVRDNLIAFIQYRRNLRF
ncbi:armadillo-type protein [Panaeolus papilionaceus]|nr:armadillo-type protein [Panaeolus papilionaceus]